MTDEQTPPRIGRYEVLTRLTAGGMAELFLAFAAGPGGFRKFVAVKRILPALKDEEDFIAMFLDEARISAALSHSNICQVFDLGEDGDELFIAMEFIAGQDLGRINKYALRKKSRLPVGFSTAVMREVCVALHYAHHFTSPSGRALPLIHRDMSPRNVMVTYTGNTKIIDFGIAKAKGSLTLTKGDRVKGSSAYMSPEQVRAEELDARSDIFSVGSSLYELLTGQRIFHGPDDVATMYKVMHDDPPPPDAVNPHVSPALSRVVMKCLEKDRKKRFESGREVAKAIEDAVGKELFDEERIARWMSENFQDAMARTREMLALAGERDSGRVAVAAQKLQVAQVAVRHDAPSDEAERDSAQTQSHGGNSDDRPTSSQLPALKKMPTILVVDDAKVGRLLVENVLKSDGHRVVLAESGVEALEILSQLKPDLIVLDVRMPGMDGFELCEKIRSKEELRLTPIVFLSAAVSLDERVKGLSVGGDDFIRKPFDGAELAARVRVHLQRVSMIENRASAKRA